MKPQKENVSNIINNKDVNGFDYFLPISGLSWAVLKYCSRLEKMSLVLNDYLSYPYRTRPTPEVQK